MKERKNNPEGDPEGFEACTYSWTTHALQSKGMSTAKGNQS
jgi:hypothetical protein